MTLQNALNNFNFNTSDLDTVVVSTATEQAYATKRIAQLELDLAQCTDPVVAELIREDIAYFKKS